MESENKDTVTHHKKIRNPDLYAISSNEDTAQSIHVATARSSAVAGGFASM